MIEYLIETEDENILACLSEAMPISSLHENKRDSKSQVTFIRKQKSKKI